MPTIEAETVIQPSLHTLEEYAYILADEASSRGLAPERVAGLRRELDTLSQIDVEDESMFLDEITDELVAIIVEGGYCVIEENDTLLVFPKGEFPDAAGEGRTEPRIGHEAA